MKNFNIPIIPLRGITVFPNMVISFPVAREFSLAAIDYAERTDKKVFLIMQKDADIDAPEVSDLHNVGTVATLKQVIKLPGSATHVIVEGECRGEINEIVDRDEFINANVTVVADDDKNVEKLDVETIAMMNYALERHEEYCKLNSKKLSSELLLNMSMVSKVGQLADMIVSTIAINYEEKQSVLEILNHNERLEAVLEILSHELQVLKIKSDIESKVKEKIDKNQKEYILREQMKVIQEELGDKDGIQNMVEELKKKAKVKKIPKHVEKVFNKEVDRLSKMSLTSPEANVVRTYLEFITELPWKEKSKEIKDLGYAEELLNKHHYGLEKVKERIIEFLAVRQNTGKIGATVVCLVGPPGVGKTSIVQSIAKATGREYIRMSLGGIKDESEIRGHRRTYVGAMSGRILNAIKQSGTINPLILLDEVDKLSTSYNGDPASALLEVLDPEQNHSFKEHYLEMSYDLSNVLFVCTANSIEKIPLPLKDRMEIIPLSSYTLEEKCQIAIQHLYDKKIKEVGLDSSQIEFEEDVFAYIIENYTKEAGVRELERLIGKIARKVVKQVLSKEYEKTIISKENVSLYLGKEKYRHLVVNENPQIGVVRGLAWTTFGGDTLEVEVGTMLGSGKIELTGCMGDVMKESAKAAVTYIRSNASKIKVNPDFYKETDIHIHIPDGAVPKDGPSAGVTMATALVSALTETNVRNDIAMTGEITITGRVLPIGGLKEKVIAAKQAGVSTVIMPFDNKNDLEEITENVKEGLNFVFAKNINDVFEEAIVKGENIWR